MQHPQANLLVIQEQEAFEICELEGFGVESRAIVIGEHPLDVVMPTLQEMIVLELGVQRVNSTGTMGWLFVEEVVGQSFS